MIPQILATEYIYGTQGEFHLEWVCHEEYLAVPYTMTTPFVVFILF